MVSPKQVFNPAITPQTIYWGLSETVRLIRMRNRNAIVLYLPYSTNSNLVEERGSPKSVSY